MVGVKESLTFSYSNLGVTETFTLADIAVRKVSYENIVLTAPRRLMSPTVFPPVLSEKLENEAPLYVDIPAVELIETNEEIMSGTPVIRGTRIPVYLIAELVEGGYSVRQITTELFPRLSKEEVVAALKFTWNYHSFSPNTSTH